MPKARVGSQFEEVGTSAASGVQLCQLSFRPLPGSSQTHSGKVASPDSENKDAHEQRPLFCPSVHVSHRFADSHRETGGFGPPAHETYSVAPEESLACSRGPGQENTSFKRSLFSPAVVAKRRQCAQRPTASSSSTRSAVVYRRLRQRLGHSLRRIHSKGRLVRLRKPVAHKLSQTKSGSSGALEVLVTVLGPDHFGSHGQHNSCLIHQQGGGYEIRLSLCPPLETAFLVQLQADSATGQAHSGKIECDSGQIVQKQTSDPYRVVPPTGGLRPIVCKVAHSAGRSFCHQVQSQTTQVHVSSTGSADLVGGCSQPELRGARCLCVSSCVSSGPASLHDPKSGISQVGPHCPRVTQHALVLGSGQHVCTGSSFPPTSRESVDAAVQSASAHRSPRSQPACLAPRASSIQAQGFSDEVATRIEAPQRQSTRAVYENQSGPYLSNGASQTRWTSGHPL